MKLSYQMNSSRQSSGVTPGIIRTGGNCHRYISFVDGRLVSIETAKKDLFDISTLYGLLNQVWTASRLGFSKLCLVLALLGILSNAPVEALPQGYDVISGDVTFNIDGNNMTIISTSDKAIINYNQFNVTQGESVHFILPGSTSSVLNRVIGNNPTSILGSIQSNGKLLLVNSSGIHIGATANINTAGFLASTLNVSNANYMADKLVFSRESGLMPSGVINEGNIEGEDFVVLAGASVRNDGTIIVPEGRVELVVGEKITVSLGESVAAEVVVNKALKQKVDDIQDAIINTGTIDAHIIELQAQLEQDMYNSVVNQEGIIKGTRVAMEGGIIRILGESDGDAVVHNTGTIEAETVTISADRVIQSGNILADGFDGQNAGVVEIQSSTETILKKGSLTSARGQGQDSNGGEITIWSDKDTEFDTGAVIDVRGGDISGDGGFVEVSGKETVQFKGQAFGEAVEGTDGEILIDPVNILIQNGGAFDPQAGASFNGFSLITLLADNDITVNSPFDTNVATGNSGAALTMRAGNDININAALTSHNARIELVADSDGNDLGGININANLGTNNGNLLLQGATVDINANVNAGTGTVFIKPSTSNPDITVAGATDNNDLAGVRLDISAAEMNRIQTDTLSIGEETLNNDIRLLGNIDVSTDTGYHLGFLTNGDFDGNGKTISLGSVFSGLEFDGVNDFLAIQNLLYNSANSINELTVVTWLKTTDPGVTSLVDFDRSEFYSLGINFHSGGADNGKVSFDTYATAGGIKDFSSNTRIDDGKVHGIAARFNASQLNEKSIFIDGTLDAQGDQYGTNVALGKNVNRFGFVGDGSEATAFNGTRNNVYFDGVIQGVQIYDRALADGEISTLHNNGPGAIGPQPNLVLGYDFTQGSGPTVTDFSGSGNTGTIVGATRVTGHDLNIQAGGNVSTGTIISDGRVVDIQAGNHLTVTGNISGNSNLVADASKNNIGNLVINGVLNSSHTPIELTGAQIDINQTVNAGTSTIEIKSSVSKDVHLNDPVDNNDSATLLDISAAEFGRLIASHVEIGSLDNSGDMTLVNSLDLSGRKSIDGGAFDLTLNAGGSYISSGNSIFLDRDSLYLDGTNDYLAINNLFENAQDISDLTVVMWVRSTDTEAGIIDFDRSEFYSLGINFASTTGNGTVSWDTNAGSTVHDFGSTTRVDDGQWHQVVATFDASGAMDKAIYIDGGLDNEINAHGGANLGKNVTRFGFVGDGSEAPAFNGARNSLYYAGQIDEVRVYDRALTAGEISTLYNNGVGTSVDGTEANLSFGYNFDEATGTNVADMSGSGNNGTLFNSPQWVQGKNLIINAGGSVDTGHIMGEGSDITITANYRGVSGTINTSGNLLATGNGTLTLKTLENPPAPETFDTVDPEPMLRDNSGSHDVNAGSGNFPVIEWANALNEPTPANYTSSLSPESIVEVSYGLLENFQSASIAYGGGTFKVEGKDLGEVAYVVQPGSNRVIVMDTRTNRVIAEIIVGERPTSISVTGKKDIAVVTNSESNTVSIINTDNYDVQSTIQVGEQPRSVVVNEEGSKAYVANFGDGTIMVVDPLSASVIKTIPIGGKPVAVSISPDGKWVYAADYRGNKILVIDTKKETVTREINVGKGPKSIAVSPGGRVLYVANYLDSSISIIDTRVDEVKHTIKVSNRPYGVSVSDDGRKVYIANRSQNLVEVVDAVSLTIRRRIRPEKLKNRFGVSQEKVSARQ